LSPSGPGAVGRGGVFDRRQFVQPAAGDDEAADMLRQVAREADELFGQRQRHADAGFGRVQPDLAHPRLVHPVAGPAMHLSRQQGDRVAGQSQRLADLAHRAARPVADHEWRSFRHAPGRIFHRCTG